MCVFKGSFCDSILLLAVSGEMQGFVSGEMQGFVSGEMQGFVRGEMQGFVCRCCTGTGFTAAWIVGL